MWPLSPEDQKQLFTLAKGLAHAILFLVAVAFFVVGGILSDPTNLGLIGAGMGILAVIGIARS